MKNIKDITISIFAIIGFIALVTGFTNKTETLQTTQLGTPDSHVWEFHLNNPATGRSAQGFSINKKTGEVRQHNTYSVKHIKSLKNTENFATYRVSSPK